MSYRINSPYQQFTDTDGSPLENGYIWVGVANQDPQTNPAAVYWDSALTLPAAQPIRTLNGYPVNNGTPTNFYAASDYSIRVMNKNGSTIYSTPKSIASFQFVSVKDFGAIGDGVTDDTTAIQTAITAAGAGTLVFPAGTYPVSQTLQQSDGQAWVGEGGQRTSTIKKMANVDLVTLGDRGRLTDLNLDCNGATYAGRGLHVTVGYSHVISRVRVADSKGVALEFATDVGGGSTIDEFEANTIDATTVAAIFIGNMSGPKPKFFNNIWLSGGLFRLGIGAGNGCSLNNFYIRNFVCDGTSVTTGMGLMHISNGRVASISDTTYLRGADNTITNVAFSGPVAFEHAQGFLVNNCSFGSGYTIDETNSQYNSISDQAKSYTPAWTQASGTQPAIGNGTITSRYVRQGYIVSVTMRITIGSTTTFGNNATGYLFSLPFRGHQGFNQYIPSSCRAYDSSAATDYDMSISLGANENTVTCGKNGQSFRDGFPFALASGDTIDIHFTYMCR